MPTSQLVSNAPRVVEVAVDEVVVVGETVEVGKTTESASTKSIKPTTVYRTITTMCLGYQRKIVRSSGRRTRGNCRIASASPGPKGMLCRNDLCYGKRLPLGCLA